MNQFGDRAGYCGAVVLCCAVLLLLRQSKAVFGGLACLLRRGRVPWWKAPLLTLRLDTNTQRIGLWIHGV